MPTRFADGSVVRGRERGVEAMLRPLRKYFLASLFLRGLGLLKKNQTTDSRNGASVSQVVRVGGWEEKN